MKNRFISWLLRLALRAVQAHPFKLHVVSIVASTGFKNGRLDQVSNSVAWRFEVLDVRFTRWFGPESERAKALLETIPTESTFTVLTRPSDLSE